MQFHVLMFYMDLHNILKLENALIQRYYDTQNNKIVQYFLDLEIDITP